MRSIELLQLALLGIALLLVVARLRVLALRRRAAYAPPRPAAHAPRRPAAGRTTPPVRRAAPPARRATPAPSPRAERDEWPFPDPAAPAPTGLLPSTASARRRARELAASGDRG
jgi:hypothetical protein